MKIIKEGCKFPLKVWGRNIQGRTLKQAKDVTNLPFIFRHVALMADNHEGYGVPIGTILPCKGFVIPNAVGVDIGCGVIALQTNLQNPSKSELKSILSKIKKKIPVGFNHQKLPQDESNMPFSEEASKHSFKLRKITQ